jgi:hypothetical protein
MVWVLSIGPDRLFKRLEAAESRHYELLQLMMKGTWLRVPGYEYAALAAAQKTAAAKILMKQALPKKSETTSGHKIVFARRPHTTAPNATKTEDMSLDTTMASLESEPRELVAAGGVAAAGQRG